MGSRFISFIDHDGHLHARISEMLDEIEEKLRAQLGELEDMCDSTVSGRAELLCCAENERDRKVYQILIGQPKPGNQWSIVTYNYDKRLLEAHAKWKAEHPGESNAKFAAWWLDEEQRRRDWIKAGGRSAPRTKYKASAAEIKRVTVRLNDARKRQKNNSPN
jgi:hypothetical protein